MGTKKEFIKIRFINKGIDLLNISNIFRDSRVISKIPQYFDKLDPPIICYQYKKPIRNAIFNYNKITADPNIGYGTQPPCKCKESKFLYQPAGHIITGDLNIIEDTELRHLCSKGPKFRLPSRIDFKVCREVIEEAIDKYCKRWCKREGVELHALKDWKNKIFKIIDIRIENFLSNPHLYRQPKTQSITSIKNKLHKLHEQFVFAPADKAANNIIIV